MTLQALWRPQICTAGIPLRCGVNPGKWRRVKNSVYDDSKQLNRAMFLLCPRPFYRQSLSLSLSLSLNKHTHTTLTPQGSIHFPLPALGRLSKSITSTLKTFASPERQINVQTKFLSVEGCRNVFFFLSGVNS